MMRVKLNSHSYQRGFATLVTTVLILFVITLTTLYTANTVIFEQNISSNQYRAEQSLAAALAGQDAGLEFYNRFDIDPANPLAPDAIEASALAVGSYTVDYYDVSTTADLGCFIDGDWGSCTALADFAGHTRIGMVSTGLGDDQTGRRVVSLLSAAAPVLAPGGTPSQPVVAQASVAITGNVTVFNRYANATVWSGESTGSGSNSAETYINDGTLDKDTATRAQMTDTSYPGVNNALLSSRADLGKNSDIIDNDSNLKGLTEDQLFRAFFSGPQSYIRGIAEGAGQLFTNVGDIEGKDGVMWVETGDGSPGDFGPFGGDVGSLERSAIVVIDGDFFMNGGTLYGLLFVIGDVQLGGNVVISGALVATGEVEKSGGTPIVVYDPEALQEPDEGARNTRGIVAGTWRDWGN